MNKVIIIFGVVIVVVMAIFAAQSAGVLNVPKAPSVENNKDTAVPAGKSLNLSNQGISSIPSYVFTRTGLEELDVSYNNLGGAIQAEIRHLANLKMLDASHNAMTGVPAEIGQLQNLQILDLSYNNLTGLPNELGNLKNLKTLDLRGNQYSKQDLDYIRGKLSSTVIILVD